MSVRLPIYRLTPERRVQIVCARSSRRCSAANRQARGARRCGRRFLGRGCRGGRSADRRHLGSRSGPTVECIATAVSRLAEGGVFGRRRSACTRGRDARFWRRWAVHHRRAPAGAHSLRDAQRRQTRPAELDVQARYGVMVRNPGVDGPDLLPVVGGGGKFTLSLGDKGRPIGFHGRGGRPARLSWSTRSDPTRPKRASGS